MSVGTWAAIVGIAVMFLLGVVVPIVRSFRKGMGPPILMSPVTRAGRRRVNRAYEKHGWPRPYDENGNLLSEGERLQRKRDFDQ